MRDPMDDFNDFKPVRLMAAGVVLTILFYAALVAIVIGGLKVAGVI